MVVKSSTKLPPRKLYKLKDKNSKALSNMIILSQLCGLSDWSSVTWKENLTLVKDFALQEK